MPGKGATRYSNLKAAPDWAKDFVNGRDAVVPFPARLKVDAFPDMGGIRIAATGAGTAAVNEIQTVTLTSATGGSFTLDGSAAIAYNAPAADVQAALEGVKGAGNVYVTGSAGGPYSVEFVGQLGAQNVPTMVVVDSTTGSGHSVAVTTATAGSAGSATIAVAALQGYVRKGSVLRFNNGASATVTADTAQGAVSVPVSGLSKALASGHYAQLNYGLRKVILSGTFCGRSIAERNNGDPFRPWAAGDDEEYLLIFTLSDANNDADAEFYRHGRLVAENYLPNYNQLSTAALARIRQLYACITAEGG